MDFFLKAMGCQILAFHCVRVFAFSIELNACHDKSIHSLFDLFCVFIDDRVSEPLERVQIFS